MAYQTKFQQHNKGNIICFVWRLAVLGGASPTMGGGGVLIFAVSKEVEAINAIVMWVW